MLRRPLLVALAAAAAGCAGPTPPPSPAPAPAERPAPAPPPAAEPAPAPAPAPAPETGIRTAPRRWWHEATLEGGVPGARLDEAHALLAGRRPAREVVVAVIDGGVDVGHEDLDDVLWVNADEVAGNGVDDDGNGYVDDVHGWNFIGGPDGRNVHWDTYEMTRLHAACTGQPAAGGLPAPDAAGCRAAAAAYEAERQEMTALAGQVAQLEQVYPAILQVLRQALGGADPTPENVAALRALDPRLAQAKGLFLQLHAAGLDEETLAEQGEEIRGRLQYGLDLAFDPRPIVGDDYADVDERLYGNPDVAGPDPSHGTAVASILAAERENGVGIEGAAAGVRIMPIRAVPNGDERDKDVANAIRYAVDNGARVINMSFGKDFSPREDAVEAAVRYADERGVLMVHAAGNDGIDLAGSPNYPDGAYDDGGEPRLWLEVGASAWQARDSLAASFSNYGARQVDLFAPGVAIHAAAPGDEYDSGDGTSLAAPVVSGVAGLLLAYFPDLDAADVRRILLETAADLRELRVVRPGEGGLVRFGDLSATGGVVDAAAAVRAALGEAGR